MLVWYHIRGLIFLKELLPRFFVLSPQGLLPKLRVVPAQV
jgi:hypothetical protein